MGTNLILGVRGIRYQVKDVNRSAAFFTEKLGFSLAPYRGPALQPGQAPAFAELSLENTSLLLSGPGASGSRPMPDGTEQGPGGWNRLVLRVRDLPALVDELKGLGAHFRNTIESGPGGRQIQLEDPDGNPIELFEPAESH